MSLPRSCQLGFDRRRELLQSEPSRPFLIMVYVDFQFGFDRRVFAPLAPPRDLPELHHRIIKEPGECEERTSPDTVSDTKSTPVGLSLQNPAALTRTIAQVGPVLNGHPGIRWDERDPRC